MGLVVVLQAVLVVALVAVKTAWRFRVPGAAEVRPGARPPRGVSAVEAVYLHPRVRRPVSAQIIVMVLRGVLRISGTPHEGALRRWRQRHPDPEALPRPVDGVTRWTLEVGNPGANTPGASAEVLEAVMADPTGAPGGPVPGTVRELALKEPRVRAALDGVHARVLADLEERGLVSTLGQRIGWCLAGVVVALEAMQAVVLLGLMPGEVPEGGGTTAFLVGLVLTAVAVALAAFWRSLRVVGGGVELSRQLESVRRWLVEGPREGNEREGGPVDLAVSLLPYAYLFDLQDRWWDRVRGRLVTEIRTRPFPLTGPESHPETADPDTLLERFCATVDYIGLDRRPRAGLRGSSAATGRR